MSASGKRRAWRSRTMHVLVNALAATNLSARNVLLGHLLRLAEWTRGDHEFTVLHHTGNADLRRDLGAHVRWYCAPSATSHWAQRAGWEFLVLPGLIRECGADLVFMCSGTTLTRCPVPQVVMALNPWAMVPSVHRGTGERCKASLQRRAYRAAVGGAAMIGYASKYLQTLYEDNAGAPARTSSVIYAGLNDDVMESAVEPRYGLLREPNRIVCASLMAPHKGVETVVDAVHTLRKDRGSSAELYIVGGWVKADHERNVRRRVAEYGLDSVVRFTGHVSREELFEQYAKASVFCLMSHCESFGIPAVEAQAFGTPVICADCCAPPEVCGDGGIYPPPGDTGGTADALELLLGDDGAWKVRSEAALRNASRYRYDLTARGWMSIFELGDGHGRKSSGGARG